MQKIDVAGGFSGGFIDSCELSVSGIVRLRGWSEHETGKIQCPRVSVDGRDLVLHKVFRYSRSDVAINESVGVGQSGLCIDCLIPEELYAVVLRDICLELDEKHELALGEFRFQKPAYDHIFRVSEPLRREHIYGSGPPDPRFNPEVLALLMQRAGDVVDFGCGSGAMVSELARLGVSVTGLELDEARIRDALRPQAVDHVVLYDGAFPSPVRPAHTVLCSEVLEHIPTYKEAAAELSRLSLNRLIVTVPDIECIPTCFSAGILPWHLLEATHCNFFTQLSLEDLFRPYFETVEFSRLGAAQVNGVEYFGSLVMVADKNL
ncbi:MAG: class I SAM-dependent methyltransferase [Alphaproteobacteria bacterium]|nr:class I SAM-dependent methyltransferase [Alphaproteobacteria bacterium]